MYLEYLFNIFKERRNIYELRLFSTKTCIKKFIVLFFLFPLY